MDITNAYRTSDELFARVRFWADKRKEAGERLLDAIALDGQYIADCGHIPSLYKPKLERFNKAVAMEKETREALGKLHAEILARLKDEKEKYEDYWGEYEEDYQSADDEPDFGSAEKAQKDYEMFYAMVQYKTEALKGD